MMMMKMMIMNEIFLKFKVNVEYLESLLKFRRLGQELRLVIFKEVFKQYCCCWFKDYVLYSKEDE